MVRLIDVLVEKVGIVLGNQKAAVIQFGWLPSFVLPLFLPPKNQRIISFAYQKPMTICRAVVSFRQHQTNGTGLGLSLTQDLVYLNRGTITCHSEEGKGTEFIVRLPIKKEAFAPDQIDEKHKIDFNIPKNTIVDINTIVPDVNADPEDPIEDGYKLLVVEDNLELLMLMQTRNSKMKKQKRK